MRPGGIELPNHLIGIIIGLIAALLSVEDASAAPGTGGDGAIPANATRAMPKVMASAAYALVRPKLPISKPAAAGPAIIPKDP